MTEFISAAQVGTKIKDGATVVIEGFIGSGVAEAIHTALGKYYQQHQHPRQLTLVHAAGIGDGKTKGMNHYAQAGMVKRLIGGHWAMAPQLHALVEANQIEAYNFPQGVISRMMRAASAHEPFVATQVGLGTFVDPDYDGGKLNQAAQEELVTKTIINDYECLLYKTIFPDVAILRGTYADDKGNVAFDEEPLTLEAVSEAMAAKNNGGIVIVQVKQKVPFGILDPKQVKLPRLLVDYIVIADDITQHQQTYNTLYDPVLLDTSAKREQQLTDFPLTQRKVIARRCAQLISPQEHVVNYGIGMPEEIAKVLKEEQVKAQLIPTIEPGTFGGTPLGGLDFGTAIAPESIIDQSEMFDFYDGGGIDITFLGLAECDQNGNINVSRFGSKIAGAGGFIDISQNTPHVVFCGTFTAGGLQTTITNGKLQIIQEGRHHKFVKQVQHLTFNGRLAAARHQEVYYITERAVFKLTTAGLVLQEIAPGIDLERDILAQMDFKPLISSRLHEMDAKIFKPEKMHLHI